MNSSFQFYASQKTPQPESRRRVLVTGAGGRIGSSFAEYARDRYELSLLVRNEKDAVRMRRFGEPIIVEDLADAQGLAALFAGVDTVVHLAADPSPDADWDSLRRNNIEATRNVLFAAAEAGCRRVVLASSIHAVSGYPAGRQIREDDAVNPGDLYGVSKCFAESLARMMAEQRDLSCIVLRIGTFQPLEKARDPQNLWMMNTFLSHRDLDQLIGRCIDDETLRFAIFHALSGNRFNRMGISNAQELLGYAPQDDFTELNEELAALHLRNQVRPHDEQEQT